MGQAVAVSSVAHRAAVLRRRGISDEVMDYVAPDGRPRYATARTLDDLRAFHTHVAQHASYLSRLMNQSRRPDQVPAALVINRWGLDGTDWPSYLRFDYGVASDFKRPDRRTKYVYAFRADYGCPHPKGTACGCCKVIDVHPLARELLLAEPTPEIFFCLEGCLKADAILSQGQAAISVASVTLWHLSRLPKSMLQLLRKAPRVFVVPDSDYRTLASRSPVPLPINEKVRLQTDRCVAWLRRQGITAWHLIPPYWDLDQAKANYDAFGIDVLGRSGAKSTPERYKIGIDDHLAVGGNLGRYGKKLNPQGVSVFELHDVKVTVPSAQRVRKDRAGPGRAQALAEWLLGFGGPNGMFMIVDAVRDLDVNRKTIERAMYDLKTRGIFRFAPGKPLGHDEYGAPLGNAPTAYAYQLSDPSALQV